MRILQTGHNLWGKSPIASTGARQDLQCPDRRHAVGGTPSAAGHVADLKWGQPVRQNRRVEDLHRADPPRSGLRRRILLWFLVLSLVPLFVSNTVGYIVTRRIIEGQVRSYLTAIAQIQAQLIADQVERHRLYLDALAADNELARVISAANAAGGVGQRQDSASAALSRHLARALMQLQSLGQLLVFDSTGQVVASTRPDLMGTDWSDSRLFRAGRERRYFAKGWGGGALAGPVHLLATPVRDRAQTRTGVLAAVVGLESESDFFRIPPYLAKDVHIYVLDELGYPVIVPHPHPMFEFNAPFPSPLVNQPPGGVVRYANYEGVDVLATSVTVPGLPWLYVAELPVTSAFGQLRSLAALAAALEVVFALLLVAVVWVVARSIVAPLRGLVAAADRIRGGEFGVEVQIDRDDELGELGRTFNQMSNELRTSADQIEELHHQELRRAAQLASVGELAAGIAHEIKNPLAGMVSGMDLLASRLETDPRAEGLLSQMQAQLRRIESAIRDLLSYARPKEPRLVVAAPHDLVKRVADLVGPQAEAARIRIAARTSRSDDRLRVDPELMTQALVNLALNGIQAMEPGGTLTISAEAANGEIRVSISDTGPGLPAKQQETIFRPFYTTKHQGTGLGLAISRGIVERHGGRIEVESELGEGATFTLVLPAADQHIGAP